MGTLLYTHNKHDLENIIKHVVNEVRKTELLSSKSITPEEDKLTQKEAAAFLGISVVSLISWKKKNLIPFYQIGRSIFYSKSELLQTARKNPKLVKSTRS